MEGFGSQERLLPFVRNSRQRPSEEKILVFRRELQELSEYKSVLMLEENFSRICLSGKVGELKQENLKVKLQ